MNSLTVFLLAAWIALATILIVNLMSDVKDLQQHHTEATP